MADMKISSFTISTLDSINKTDNNLNKGSEMFLMKNGVKRFCTVEIRSVSTSFEATLLHALHNRSLCFSSCYNCNNCSGGR